MGCKIGSLMGFVASRIRLTRGGPEFLSRRWLGGEETKLSVSGILTTS